MPASVGVGGGGAGKERKGEGKGRKERKRGNKLAFPALRVMETITETISCEVINCLI